MAQDRAFTADIERENLEAHVEMAHERSRRMNDRLEAVDEKIDTLATKVDRKDSEIASELKLMREEHLREIREMREETSKENRALKTAVITSTATVVVGLLGLLTMIITKLGPAISKLGLL